MTALPLEQIGPTWRHHCSALWWLALLYRRPREFHRDLLPLPQWSVVRVGLVLFLHALPYILLIDVLGRLILFRMLVVPPGRAISLGTLGEVALVVALMTVVGFGIGFFIGVSEEIDGVFACGIVGAIAGAITSSISGIAFGLPRWFGWILDAFPLGIFVGICFGLSNSTPPLIRITFAILSGISAGTGMGLYSKFWYGISYGISYQLGLGLAMGIALLRMYYFSVHLFFTWFIWPVTRGRWYPWHPVAWDDLCAVPFPALDRLLLAYAGCNRAAALQEIERLIDNYPSQRMAALRAKAILQVREAANEQRLSRLDTIVAGLPEGNKGFLQSTPRLRGMVGEIAALQRRLDTQDRPFLRGPTAELLVEKIRTFESAVSGFPAPLGPEFRAAARAWLAVAERQHRDVVTVLSRRPALQVFRAGDPVDRRQEAFIPRGGVLGELDRQLSLSTGCPGLILYGRRRMGKSTLLKNLDGFLPTSAHLVTVSMQDPSAFSSQADLIGRLMQELQKSCPQVAAPGDDALTLKRLFENLGICEQYLEAADQRLLIAIDEYEHLDRKIGEGVFSQDLLAALRESMQSHRRLTWIFAGSHAIMELNHAPWSSYLVSTRTLEVPLFTEPETRLLLTEPLRHSPLWDKDDHRRPRFDSAFWGEGGIERIHAEAAGWPHLVQLLAETTVDLCNDRERAQVDRALLDHAIAKAVILGDAVLRQLMQPEDASPHEWEYLRGFRTRDTQSPPDEEAVYQALRRRLLVLPVEDGWRLRVPLMQRWLQERG